MKKIYLRFYEELNDFLPEQKRKQKFEHRFFGRTSIKDIIESLGVPHTEVDLILVNGVSVGFDYIVKNEDQISVFPEFESFDIKNVQRLRPKPLRNPKFILDVHLGSLARYMRMCGFDVLYRNDFNDNEIIKIAVVEKRTILTRDLGILKNKNVERGYWIRNTKTINQLEEVIERFHLKDEIKEFSRCIECNNELCKVSKDSIIDKLPPRVKNFYDEFYFCVNCKKIYWKGSHYDKMAAVIAQLKKL